MQAYRCSPTLQVFNETNPPGSELYVNNPVSPDGLDAQTNHVIDLSELAHRLIVGEGAADWLLKQGLDSLPEPGQCVELAGYALLACENRKRYFYVSGPQSGTTINIDVGRHDGVLILDYECLDIAMGGADIDRIISEATSTNYQLRQPQDWIATLFARAEVHLKKMTIQQAIHYRLFAAPADGQYLYRYLTTSITELNGQVADLNTYQTLLNAGG